MTQTNLTSLPSVWTTGTSYAHAPLTGYATYVAPLNNRRFTQRAAPSLQGRCRAHFRFMNHTTQEQTSTQTRRRWLAGIASLVLLGCCAWTGLLTWFFAPLIPYLANYLDVVQGQVTVIAPAQWRGSGQPLSPDGRKLVIGWNRSGTFERVIWDLTNDTHVPLLKEYDGVCWLNSEQLVMRLGVPDRYLIINAHDGKGVLATWTESERPIAPATLEQFRQHLQAADHIYVLRDLVWSGFIAITFEHGQPFVYVPHIPYKDGIAFFKNLAQGRDITYLPEPCYQAVEPSYSPDGQFYAKQPMGNLVKIYTRQGQVVAQAGKTDWSPRILGWAHDGSGVYFSIVNQHSGSWNGTVLPYNPIFKLSVLTPEQQRWQTITTGAWWAGGVAAAGGAVWWAVRRRRWQGASN